MGLLLSGSYQERSIRSDVISNGAPSLRSDIIPGQQIYTPNGDYEPLINGKRRRIRLQGAFPRSEEHTSELQSLMSISYARSCLKKKKEYSHERPQPERT